MMLKTYKRGRGILVNTLKTCRGRGIFTWSTPKYRPAVRNLLRHFYSFFLDLMTYFLWLKPQTTHSVVGALKHKRYINSLPYQLCL